MIQASQLVFDTSYKPYISSSNNEEAPYPDFLYTKKELNVTKKMRQFCTDVAVLVQDLVESITASCKIKLDEHPIETRKMICMMMANKNSLDHDSATLNIPESTVHDYYKNYCSTGRSHKLNGKSHTLNSFLKSTNGRFKSSSNRFP